MRCAEVLMHAGLRPIVIDEAERPGGQVYRQPPMGRARRSSAIYGFEATKAEAIHRAIGDARDLIDCGRNRAAVGDQVTYDGRRDPLDRLRHCEHVSVVNP